MIEKHEDLLLGILRFLKNNNLWHKVVAYDLETKILEGDTFLSNERILGISLAKRNKRGDIIKENIILSEDSCESEEDLLDNFCHLLYNWDPIVLIGYCSNSYDFPLITLKWSRYRAKKNQLFGIKKCVYQSLHLDLYDLTKYIIQHFDKKPLRFRKLENIMTIYPFDDINYYGKKNIFSLDEHKGRAIFEAWKTKDRNFEEYLIGEANDLLLIVERIMDIISYDRMNLLDKSKIATQTNAKNHTIKELVTYDG